MEPPMMKDLRDPTKLSLSHTSRGVEVGRLRREKVVATSRSDPIRNRGPLGRIRKNRESFSGGELPFTFLFLGFFFQY
jgi:hypothetical protein